MIRPRLSATTMVVVMTLGAATGALASSGGKREAQEIAAALNARTSISQAIAEAEKQSGGLAIKVDVEHRKGSYLFEVKTLSKEKASEVLVDPATGRIVRVDDEGFVAKLFDKDDHARFTKLAASPTKLAAAIAAAEGKTGGKAFEARYRTKHGKMVFEVETARGETVQKVKIDPATGKVLTVADAGKRDRDEH